MYHPGSPWLTRMPEQGRPQVEPFSLKPIGTSERLLSVKSFLIEEPETKKPKTVQCITRGPPG
jgi:hypothetical protein